MIGYSTHSEQISLDKVSIKGIINDFFGNFVVEQEYINKYNNELFGFEYVFPLDSSCFITDVKIIVDDMTLTTILKSKEDTKQNYISGINNRHKSLSLEKHDDNYYIKIENIKPYEKIKFIYSYFQEIMYYNNKYVCIIPTGIKSCFSEYKLINTSEIIKEHTNDVKLSIDIK
jgi:Vault protein inter-alpha-trypsin.